MSLKRLVGLNIALALMACSIATPAFADNESGESYEAVTLIGVSEINGSGADLSGLLTPLSDGTPHNQLGGFSAIEYAGNGDLYYVLPDRGPKDGAVDYLPRFHTMRITIQPDAETPVQTQLVATQIFRNTSGQSFTGLASAFEPTFENAGRFDPEGIRVRNGGNIVVSDEYGPHVIEFDQSGNEVCRYDVPVRYLIENPGIDKPDENGKNTFGRSCNRGMEGLGITSDQRLFGLMQSPLLQDSVRDEEGKPKGLNCRMMQLGAGPAEMLYHLDDESNKLNELLSIDGDSFLVIERDGEAGDEAVYKKIIRIETSGASDISGLETLPREEIPEGVSPVQKEVFIDLLNPRWGLTGEQMPEKIEGLCFGPDLADGRKTILVMSDNDFESANPSRLFVFAVTPEHLGN
ncbi:MAG: esterase-like activity of phytase family protein [Planctomycetota bacterium]